MDAHKEYIVSIFIIVMMLFLLKKTGIGYSAADVWQRAGHDPILRAQIEREQEEIAYQNAIRWDGFRGCT